MGALSKDWVNCGGCVCCDCITPPRLLASDEDRGGKDDNGLD